MARSYTGVLLGVLAVLGLLGTVMAADKSAKLVTSNGVAHVESGSTYIDVSASDYTSYITLLTIENDQAMLDTVVTFDLDHGNVGGGGFAVGHTSQTITFIVARKVGGTGYRLDEQSDTTAISGTNANECAVSLNLGMVTPDEDVRIYVKLSAENSVDVLLPFVCTYRSGQAATFTTVSN